MSSLVIVFSTQHELQGEKFAGYVKDPLYEQLLKNLIAAEKLDFVFEEASGKTPTIAEKLALAEWGPNHYLDVDPNRDQRESLGISATTNEPWMIGTLQMRRLQTGSSSNRTQRERSSGFNE
jgi:hypothetical protein